MRQFISTAAGDRLYACWLLSLLGMTARKPLVPPELRELLSLMVQLTENLPIPAHGQVGAWGVARSEGLEPPTS